MDSAKFGVCGVGRQKGGVSSDVTAVFKEARIVDLRVPVPALPAADGEAEDLGEVVVISWCVKGQ